MKKDTAWEYMEWDELKSVRFNDWACRWGPFQDQFFSKQVGRGIIFFLDYLSPNKGCVLDYGCGPGYLIERLLNAGFKTEGLEFSQKVVDSINKKFSGHQNWNGASCFSESRLPYPDDRFDCILLVEVIEHILPKNIDNILKELYRILKPHTGRMFITTPNTEDLEKNMILCPETGKLFHRMQHVSTFTIDSLSELLQKRGFKKILCNTTDFARFQEKIFINPLNWSPRYFMGLAKKLVFSTFDMLKLPTPFIAGGWYFNHLIGNGPHLFWFGKK